MLFAPSYRCIANMPKVKRNIRLSKKSRDSAIMRAVNNFQHSKTNTQLMIIRSQLKGTSRSQLRGVSSKELGVSSKEQEVSSRNWESAQGKNQESTQGNNQESSQGDHQEKMISAWRKRRHMLTLESPPGVSSREQQGIS